MVCLCCVFFNSIQGKVGWYGFVASSLIQYKVRLDGMALLRLLLSPSSIQYLFAAQFKQEHIFPCFFFTQINDTYQITHVICCEACYSMQSVPLQTKTHILLRCAMQRPVETMSSLVQSAIRDDDTHSIVIHFLTDELNRLCLARQGTSIYVDNLL